MTDDYYRFDDRQMMMIGEHTGKQFRLGDEVTVRVVCRETRRIGNRF